MNRPWGALVVHSNACPESQLADGRPGTSVVDPRRAVNKWAGHPHGCTATSPVRPSGQDAPVPKQPT